MAMNGGKNGFHLTHETTAEQMYEFFTHAITDVYRDLEAEISICSTADSNQTMSGPILTIQQDQEDTRTAPPGYNPPSGQAWKEKPKDFPKNNPKDTKPCFC